MEHQALKTKKLSVLNAKRYPLNTTTGFSLPEIIVYLAIVALLFVIVINTLISMSSTSKVLKLAKNLNGAVTTSLERMTREIRQANGVDSASSVLNVSPGKLVLNSSDSNGNPISVEFSMLNGVLYLKQGGVSQGPLTLASTTVDNLVFKVLQNSKSTAVKIEYQLTATDGSRAKTENFYTTTILRGSYSN